MSRFPYQFFDDYIVRTPIFSYKKFQKNTNNHEISNHELKAICNNSIFMEAIYLASPYLYEEIRQWLLGKELSDKQVRKLVNTILKYFGRMSTRCTPFGLFSEVSLGKFTNEKIENNRDLRIRDTRLDMHFLVNLAYHFIKIPEIRNRLFFYPNNTIYKIGEKIRYVEYEYFLGKRNYIISSAPFSEELQKVLDFSVDGKTTGQLANILVNEEITVNNAEEFIEELIDNQVLVSEIEANVSGNDFLDTLIFALSKIEAKEETQILLSIKSNLGKIDQKLGNSVTLYSEIEELIKAFGTDYEKKYLFQTDLYNESKFSLSTNWETELKKGISFLNKVTLSQQATHFEKFKKAFGERFETQEMRLSYVLDSEVGIGYKQNVTVKGIHPYLEDLTFPSKRNDIISFELNSIHQILNEKLQQALWINQTIINLTDEDFKDFDENWDDLPDTISFMAEIISENSKEKLFLNGSTGNSAANLLGRFCSEKSDVQKLTKKIAQKEEDLNPDYILAEIIHLPEARIGNVIRRPTLRNYEIPYLAQSVLPKENQIFVDDLYISLKNNRIVLRSKSLNREVKPYLTNAHNYFGDSLPVYHFLSDINSQNKKSGLYFNWGGLENIYNFLPRVEYKNIILSKAQWKLSEKDFTILKMIISDKDNFLDKIKKWRNEKKIPAWIQLVKSDNKLTINLENYELLNMFLDSAKHEEPVIIEEFLYNEKDNFKREFIFPMYKVK